MKPISISTWQSGQKCVDSICVCRCWSLEHCPRAGRTTEPAMLCRPAWHGKPAIQNDLRTTAVTAPPPKDDDFATRVIGGSRSLLGYAIGPRDTNDPESDDIGSSRRGKCQTRTSHAGAVFPKERLTGKTIVTVYDTIIAMSGTTRICLVLADWRSMPILAPLGNIAKHVMKAPPRPSHQNHR